MLTLKFVCYTDGIAGCLYARLTALLDAVRMHNGGDVALLDRTAVGPTSMMHSGINQAREFDDPPGLNEKTEFLLREWVSLFHSPAAGRDSAKAFAAFVAQVHLPPSLPPSFALSFPSLPSLLTFLSPSGSLLPLIWSPSDTLLHLSLPVNSGSILRYYTGVWPRAIICQL